jgi:L-malate glycosyltransferase
MTKVVIFQHRLLHYRLEFFTRLKEILAEKGIELVLVHGQASPQEMRRKDEGVLDWAVCVKNRFFNYKGRDLMWQPRPKETKGAALVIVMQESRILSNYPILFRMTFRGAKIGYWGHGRNYQSTAPSGFRERWKRWLLNGVDRWFAYTEMTVNYLADNGVSLNKITNLNNAIDVSGFQN